MWAWTIQKEKLKKFLKFANNFSPYWNKVFNEFNVNINSTQIFLELKKIPIHNKEDLIINNYEIHSKFNFNKTFISKTSGTTGKRLTFKKDEVWDSYNRASIFRGLSWHKVKPTDFSLYFWGYDFSFFKKIKTYFLDFLQFRFRVFDFHYNSIKKIIKNKDKIVYIHGYSSMIMIFQKL